MDDASTAAAPLPGEPQVGLPVAVAVVLAAVLLALVVIGAVVSVQPDRVGGGPALAPPAAPVDTYRFSIDRSRRLTYAELTVVLPGAPFTCTPQKDPPPVGLLAFVSCDAPVHPDYDAAGHDWSAVAGVAVAGDAMVDRSDLHRTADQVFEALQTAFYPADNHPVVKKKTGFVVDDVAPAGSAYAVYADVQVRSPGLKTDHDRLLVIVIRLTSGQHVVYFSDRPTDASPAVTNALRATLTSVSAKR